MDEQPKIDPKFAEVLKTSDAAYKVEEEEIYKDRIPGDKFRLDKRVIDGHNAAVKELTILTKKGRFFSFLSLEKRRLKRQAETKIGLHQERIKAIQPFLADANLSDPPSQPLMPPVTTRFICLAGDLDNGSNESLYGVTEMCDLHRHASLSQIEIMLPQKYGPDPEPLTATLRPGAPTETWVVRRPGNTAAALQKGFVFTVKDATETNTLYIVEAPVMSRVNVPLARLSRAGEYPSQAALVKIWPAEMPMYTWQTRMMHKGRPMKIENDLLCEGVSEAPDVRNDCPWGPRRFVYGGRRFVWKPRHPEKGREDGNFETLYEYQTTRPSVGAKPGRMDDDAWPTPLCWCDPVPGFMFEFKWTVYFVGGLDALFKEHVIASQIAKMAAMHGNAKDTM